MEFKLKHRLIIAIVILALLVIFVPMLFSKHAHQNLAFVHTPPAAPTKPTASQQLAQNDIETQQLSEEEMASPSDQTSEEATTSELPTPAKTLEPDYGTSLESEGTATKETESPAPAVAAPSAPAATMMTPAPAESVKEPLKAAETPMKTVMPPKMTQMPMMPKPMMKQPMMPNKTMSPKPMPTMKPQQMAPKQLQPSSAPQQEISQPLSMASTTLGNSEADWLLGQTAPIEPALPAVKPSLKQVLAKSSHRISAIKKRKEHKTVAVQHQHVNQLQKAKANSHAFVVQLGMFGNTQNAIRLVKTLRHKGFHAFGYVKHKGKGTRVFVGPVVKLAHAQLMAEKLEKVIHIKGIVVAFDATKLH